MTKPREKTREELTAEIEESKKKIRQFENREKIIKQKLSVEERKARTHRLCKRGGFMESLVPELIAMPDEGRESLFTACLDERASTGVFEKTSRGRERGVIPLEQRAHLYTLAGVCALPRALSPHRGTFPALRYGGFAATRGCTPCAASRLSLHTHKNSTPAPASVLFLRVLLSYPGGDTHSHLPL